MQSVGEDVDLRLPPGHELAVKPDGAVAVVEGNDSHFEVLVSGACHMPLRQTD